MSSKVTRKNIEAVLAFLTLFTHKDAKLYEIQTESLTLDPYNYSKEFDNFLASLHQENFIVPCDWTTWQDEANLFGTHLELLISSDISTLQKLFTIHVWKERFCSCHLAAMIKNGHFLAMLNKFAFVSNSKIFSQIALSRLNGNFFPEQRCFRV